MSEEEIVASVKINGCRIEIRHGQDIDLRHYLRLRAIDCVLEGEEPGLYYPLPLYGESGPSIEQKAAAWEKVMEMWDDPENEEDLNGGDLVELVGQLRSRMEVSDA